MAVQISGNDITVPRDGTFSRNVSIAGTLTYEDVTNIDSVGLVTARTGIEIGARPGVAASISIDGNMVVSGITTIGNSNGGNEKLNVHGAIRSSSSSVNFGAGLEGTILDYDTANDVARFGHVNGASGSARDVVFLNGGAEKVRIKSDGNVGIGTDNPAQALHVNRSSGDTYIRAQGGTNQGLLINKTDGTLIGGFVSGGTVGGSANDIAVRVETGNNIVFAHGTSERLRITSDGHLRIGNDTGIIQLGTGQDLQLIHDGSASKIIAKPEFMLQSDEFTFRTENGSSTHVLINSSGQVGIGTLVPGESVSINGNVKFASGTSVGGSAMGIYPLGDITLASNASASLALGARFTGIVIVSGYQNDTAAAVFALASASDYSSDSATRLHYQSHNAANTTDLTISSPSHGGTNQFQLNQTGTATKTYKVIAFGIKG